MYPSLSTLQIQAYMKDMAMSRGTFDLGNGTYDIGEHSNVAAGNRELTRSMASELSDRLRHWNAPMPTVRATGKPVPMPDETDAFAALKK